MKYIITENQMRILQLEYLDFLFKDIYKVKSKDLPNSIIWKKDNEVVLIRTPNRFWVSYWIWDNISNMLCLEYDETEELIKNWAEEYLELEGIKPKRTEYIDDWNNP